MIRVFYHIHKGPCVDADQAVPLPLAAIVALAGDVASHDENFIGFIDAADTTLQIAPQGNGRFHIEMPVPARRGSLAMMADRATYDAVIAELQAPLAVYAQTLPLDFQAWQFG